MHRVRPYGQPVADSRDRHMRREKGQALVRALHLSELQAAGEAREKALRKADEQLNRIGRLLPDALGSGISLAEIARVTGVSRPTLYELRGRHSQKFGDLLLAVLQTAASRGPVDRAGVAAFLERPVEEIRSVVDTLVDGGLVVEDFNDDPEDPMMELTLTGNGFHALEEWDFDERVEDGGGAE